nr:hypothetical protein [Tanacetum cinerariifolium]
MMILEKSSLHEEIREEDHHEIMVFLEINKARDARDTLVSPKAPPSPDYIPGLEYPEYLPPADDMLLAEEQPLPVAVSPTAESPVYITKVYATKGRDTPVEEQPLPAADSPTADSPGSISESGPKEDPADYPANGGDNDDDDDELSDDDEDDDDDEDEDEERMRRRNTQLHPTLSHHHQYTILQLGYLSQFRHLHQFVSSPLLVSSPPMRASPTYPLGYRAAMIWLRAETPSTIIEADVLEVTLSPRKRLCIALGLRYENGKSSSVAAARPTRGFRVDYGFVATLDDEIRRDPQREVGYGITDTWNEMLVGMPRAPA